MPTPPRIHAWHVHPLRGSVDDRTGRRGSCAAVSVHYRICYAGCLNHRLERLLRALVAATGTSTRVCGSAVQRRSE